LILSTFRVQSMTKEPDYHFSCAVLDFIHDCITTLQGKKSYYGNK